MDCKDAKQKISEALDGSLPASEQELVEEHCGECEACKAEKADLVRLNETLTDLSEPQVEPPDPEAAWKSIESELGESDPGAEDPFQEPIELDSSGAYDIRNLVEQPKGEDEAPSDVERISASDLFGVSTGDEHEGELELASVAPPPVLMPVSRGRPSWVVPVAVTAAIVVLGAVAVGTILFIRSGQEHTKRRKEKERLAQNVESREVDKAAPEQPMSAAEPGAARKKAAGAPAGSDPLASIDEPGDADEQAGKGDTESGEGGEAAESSNGSSARVGGAGGASRSRRSHRRRRRSRTSRGSSLARRSSSRSSRPRPDSRARPRTRASRAPTRTLDDPLNALLAEGKGSGAREARPRESKASLPRMLSRSQVKRVMSRANGRMKRCYQKHKEAGMLRVRVSVKGSTGRIVSARVKGKFAGTPTARCALRAVRRLRFPKFQNSTQKFSYPYLLR